MLDVVDCFTEKTTSLILKWFAQIKPSAQRHPYLEFSSKSLKMKEYLKLKGALARVLLNDC